MASDNNFFAACQSLRLVNKFYSNIAVPFLFHNEVLLPVTSLQYPSIKSARLSAWSRLEQVILSVSAAPATLNLIHAFACSLQSDTSVCIDCIWENSAILVGYERFNVTNKISLTNLINALIRYLPPFLLYVPCKIYLNLVQWLVLQV